MRSTGRSQTQRYDLPRYPQEWWSLNHLDWSHADTLGSAQKTLGSLMLNVFCRSTWSDNLIRLREEVLPTHMHPTQEDTTINEDAH